MERWSGSRGELWPAFMFSDRTPKADNGGVRDRSEEMEVSKGPF